MAWEQKTTDQGRWNEYVNTDTGESSIKYHTPKVIWQSCTEKGHTFVLSGNREVTCTKCGQVKTMILGLQKLVDGKLVDIPPQTP